MDTLGTDPFAAFRCPNCGADSTAKFSAINEGGTSHVRSSSTHTAVAISGGKLTPVLGSSSTSGVQQSELARKTAPPQMKQVFGLAAFLGTVIIAAPIASVVVAAIWDFFPPRGPMRMAR